MKNVLKFAAMFVFAAVITACGGEQATKETDADKSGTTDDKSAKMNGDGDVPAASADKKSSKMDGVKSTEAKDAKKEKMTK